jgi:hypothetical protein
MQAWGTGAGRRPGPAKYGRMRKLLASALALVAASLPTIGVPAAHAQQAEVVPVFVAGGTNLTNGYFFPGTAIYDGNDFVGVPLQIQQGQDVQLVNTDPAPLTNSHTMVSWLKTKKGRPLFHSGYVRGPATVTVKTSQLKPGLYPYYCNVHAGMYGLLEVTKL